MTCWIWASVAPSCITMTMGVACSPGTFPLMTGKWPVLFLVFLRAAAGIHSVAFGGAGFVNDALEEAANGGVGQRAGIVALGVREDFVFAVRLIERNFRRLFELADFERALRTRVQEFDELLVDFIDAAAPVAEIHGATSRRERPWRAASLSERIFAARAEAAASTECLFSISETRAEPMTAASARPPRTETWPGSEIPKPTAIGRCVTARARRKREGRSSGRASLAPVTPVREMR